MEHRARQAASTDHGSDSNAQQLADAAELGRGFAMVMTKLAGPADYGLLIRQMG
ncbi:hypothetical protein [Streptosporangium amethystogenes]|uniref:hypothetical protein n=1 Tax=Streptosporangium amethystogenes TaxID=2002 RepID=UPI0012FA3807|nr:hypothetical protein [Streptosporangium amethystogenes]